MPSTGFKLKFRTLVAAATCFCCVGALGLIAIIWCFPEKDAVSAWSILAATVVAATVFVFVSSLFLLRAMSRQYFRLLTSEAIISDKNEELKTANTTLDAALDNMSQGLCLFDKDQRLVVSNRRYAEMYGLPDEAVVPGIELREILRRRVELGHAPEDHDRYVAVRLAEVVAGKPYNVINVLSDGRSINVVHRPLPDGGWVATHEDVTSKLEETKIHEQRKLQLDAALENMSQGLCLFDKDQRLVVSNRRYAEMYGLPDEDVVPGTTFRQILRHRAELGGFQGDAEAYVGDRIDKANSGMAYRAVSELSDGRFIDVTHRPLSDGGWVATHEDVTSEKKAEANLLRVARHDALTGLPSRAYFRELLEIRTNAAAHAKLALLFLDLNRFKQINDTLGHAVGDHILECVADRLRSTVAPTDYVGRLGGDEFAVLMTAIACRADAEALANRIRSAIAAPYKIDGHSLVIDVCIGIAIAPDDASEVAALLKASDLALYEAKKTGRGAHRCYVPAMNEEMARREALERDMRVALDRGEFELFYQPIASLTNNKISSFEALVRWRHPTLGMVSPSAFIPVAEETGIIGPLGYWILKTACAEAATWPDHISLAINISPIQLADKNFPAAVVGAIASAGLPAHRLVIEITESAFMRDSAATISMLRGLHDLGIRFSMDDFGTGYSSLGYLLNFPFSQIKIDRSFITDLADRKEPRIVVQAVVDMSRSLSITVVAEGVETAAQLDHVRALGCDEMQGYLLSPPRPASEIRRFFVPTTARQAASSRVLTERLKVVGGNAG